MIIVTKYTMETDFELCKNKNYYAIFSKYTNLFYKVWDSLSPALKFQIWPDEGDFFSFCYEKTVMAVNSIKPEKIKNPNSWTIYIQLFRYIKTYACREIKKEYKNNACSLDAFIEDHDFDENAALHTYDYPEVDMSMFNQEELDFIDFLQSGHKWHEKYTRKVYNKLRESITSKILD